MSLIVKRTGVPPARRYPPDFSGLARIVVGQQLSAQSAAAIWSRIETALVPVAPKQFLGRNDADLKALGLSNGKIRTLRALSRAVTDEGLDIPALNAADEQVIVEKLTAVHGIGPWTVDIYLLFALCRRDAFPTGDLALQLAVQHHFKLKQRPSPLQLARIAERRRPSRAVAAHLLWADYAFARKALVGTRPKPSLVGIRKSLE
jgi:DNA-3-methyladenine glycosylase II